MGKASEHLTHSVLAALGRLDAASLRRAYERDGFAILRAALDPPTVRAAVAHLEALRDQARLGPDAGIVAAAPQDAFAVDLAADPRLTVPAAAVLGTSVACFGFTYLCKPARVGLPASWHQDGQPWAERLGGRSAVTAWVALTVANEANGCLRVVPGSHGLAAQRLEAEADGASLFGARMDYALVDETGAVSIEAEPGDLLLHHPNLVHGSGPNPSPTPRLALAVRYHSTP
jgi:ectoine hydroxylase-related dioxygenase (phytanoyl-CoA dioxygenase family)